MRFGKYNVPDDVLWIAGITLPLVGAALWSHFRADPTDVVTDVQMGAPGTVSMTIVYNAGPTNTVTVPVTAAVWATEGANIVTAARLALMGFTRDRIASIPQIEPGYTIT